MVESFNWIMHPYLDIWVVLFTPPLFPGFYRALCEYFPFLSTTLNHAFAGSAVVTWVGWFCFCIVTFPILCSREEKVYVVWHRLVGNTIMAQSRLNGQSAITRVGVGIRTLFLLAQNSNFSCFRLSSFRIFLNMGRNVSPLLASAQAFGGNLLSIFSLVGLIMSCMIDN